MRTKISSRNKLIIKFLATQNCWYLFHLDFFSERNCWK